MGLMLTNLIISIAIVNILDLQITLIINGTLKLLELSKKKTD
jgi:hypothetical protein